MKDFFVRFHQDFEHAGIKYSRGQIIECTEKDVWKWAERSKQINIKLAIYEAEMVCDLS